jgi:hypothetical protein
MILSGGQLITFDEQFVIVDGQQIVRRTMSVVRSPPKRQDPNFVNQKTKLINVKR